MDMDMGLAHGPRMEMSAEHGDGPSMETANQMDGSVFHV